MKYLVVTPLARSDSKEGTQVFTTGDLIEITDKAEAERMIAANIIAPIAGAREIRVETADLKPIGVEKTVGVKTPKTAKLGKKKG